MSECYIHPSISRTALNQMLDDFRAREVNCHTFEVYMGEELLVRFASQPYSCTDPCEMYSLSKSFTATAIGFAVTEGVLSLDTTLVELFPDKLPETVSPLLAEMTIRHLLTLSTGHDTCTFRRMSDAEDAAKEFLSAPIVTRPGTHFCYDTGATCMLGIVLERVTGKNPLEYLFAKLSPIADLDHVYWNQTKDGSTESGVGLHASCDDIAKLGILYANGGKLHGKQLLSPEYVQAAGTPQVCILNNGSVPDHDTGYGYQFWMKRGDGFDGEGSFGQYCFAFPSKKLSIAMQTESQPGHDPVPAIYEFIDHMLDEDVQTPLVRLQEYTPLSTTATALPFAGEVYIAETNPMEITLFSLTMDGTNLVFRFSDRQSCQCIVAGNGRFVTSEWSGRHMMPKLGIMRSDYSEVLKAACSYQSCQETVKLQARLLNSPHLLTLRFTKTAAEQCTIEITSSLSDGIPSDCRRIIGKRS